MASSEEDRLYDCVKCELKQFQIRYWAPHDQSWPDWAYHYTGLKEFENILQSGVFWATSMQDAKDQTEGKYAVDVANAVLAAHPEWPFGGSVRALYPHYSMLPGLGTPARWNAFMVCFCATGTDEHLWGQFGDGGTGVAIGINTKHWRTSRDTSFFPMVYARSEQEKAIEAVCEEATKLHDQWHVLPNSALHNHFCAALSYELTLHTLLRFKIAELMQEQEWRMLQEFAAEHAADQYSRDGRMVHYVKIPIDKKAICWVVLGPKADAANMQRIQEWLCRADMPHVAVRLT